jgi:hypothetical protein
MPSHKSCFLILITFFAIGWFGAKSCLAQNSDAEFQKIFGERAVFAENDFVALKQGETLVKLLPAQDKREVAVRGLVRLHAPAELFLNSFRETMVRRSNPAILEIGSFGSVPALTDLQMLTIEDRDIEDLKDCVVGDCRLKLSTAMIERLHQEVNWEAPNYRARAIQLLKTMLLDYVRDYMARGDVALIRYNDKAQEVRLAEEQRDLMAASSYGVLTEIPQSLKTLPKPELKLVDNAIVWSKIKSGLKPVIAFNHIMIFKREQNIGTQILIASKQIYANHYFDSSLALTAFLNISGANPGSYLFYENHSRADGLDGPFSSMKRSIVENKALESVKAILHQSQTSLEARALNTAGSAPAPGGEGRSWRHWTLGRIHVFFWLLLIMMIVAGFMFLSYDWKSSFTRTTHP